MIPKLVENLIDGALRNFSGDGHPYNGFIGHINLVNFSWNMGWSSTDFEKVFSLTESKAFDEANPLRLFE